jgi:hypothetical protein
MRTAPTSCMNLRGAQLDMRVAAACFDLRNR